MQYITVHGFKTPEHETLINVDEIVMVSPGPAVAMTKDRVNELTAEMMKKEFDMLDCMIDVVGVEIVAKIKEERREKRSEDRGHLASSILALQNDVNFGAMETVAEIVEKLDEVSKNEFKDEGY